MLPLAGIGEKHVFRLGRKGGRSIDSSLVGVTGVVVVEGIVVLVLVAVMGTFGANMV